MQSAVARATAVGTVIGERERVTPEQALAGYLSSANSPGGGVRKIAVAEPADMCLLVRPFTDVKEDLAAALVSHTVVAGELIYSLTED